MSVDRLVNGDISTILLPLFIKILINFIINFTLNLNKILLN